MVMILVLPMTFRFLWLMTWLLKVFPRETGYCIVGFRNTRKVNLTEEIFGNITWLYILSFGRASIFSWTNLIIFPKCRLLCFLCHKSAERFRVLALCLISGARWRDEFIGLYNLMDERWLVSDPRTAIWCFLLLWQ